MFLVFLAIIVFACMGRRRFSGRRFGSESPWQERAESGGRRPTASMRERFEEWHRKTHGHEGADDRPADQDESIYRV